MITSNEIEINKLKEQIITLEKQIHMLSRNSTTDYNEFNNDNESNYINNLYPFIIRDFFLYKTLYYHEDNLHIFPYSVM